MKIPPNFKLGALQWSVSEVDLSVISGNLGTCASHKAHIYLEKSLETDVKQQTFCHELVHSIMFSMGLTTHDEHFVDGFATFLHQYLTQHGK
jgi:hypothetical protein